MAAGIPHQMIQNLVQGAKGLAHEAVSWAETPQPSTLPKSTQEQLVTPPSDLGQVPYTPTTFAEALLQAIGAPLSESNISSLKDWEAAEGGAWENTAAYNPMNTTLQEPGSHVMGGGNTAGVQAYPSWQEGLAATESTLSEHQYAAIVNALKQSAPEAQVSADVGASPWGTPSWMPGASPNYAPSGSGSGLSGFAGGGSPSTGGSGIFQSLIPALSSLAGNSPEFAYSLGQALQSQPQAAPLQSVQGLISPTYVNPNPQQEVNNG